MTDRIAALEKTIVKLKKELADTSEKLAQATDKAQELENLISSLPGHVYWVDREGRILGCNDEQARDFGIVSPLEMVGKTIYDFQPKKIADMLISNNNKILRSGKPLMVEEESVLLDGDEKIFFSNKAPFKDSHGNIVGIIGLSIDVTALKSTEHTLEKIIALMPGHVYWKDKNSVYLGCNDQQAKILGFSSGKEIVGKKDEDLPWGKGSELFREIDKQVMKTKKSVETEESITRPDNKPMILLSKKVPLIDKNDKVYGVLGISIDITKQKIAEKQLEVEKEKAQAANIAKTEFIANISHDIRTPLSGIINTAQVLQTKFSDKENKKFVVNIVKAGENLLHTLNEVVEFSKSESAQLPIHEERFSLRQMIRDIVESLSFGKKSQPVKLLIYYPSHVPQYLVGDRDRMNRIILNLLANAVKFTPEGSVSISVEVLKKDRTKVFIAMTVSDTGVGITSAELPFIFDKFYKVKSSYKGNSQGAGLGLAITKQFIDDIGGKIEVSSKVNQGTVFTCTIPFKLPKTSRFLKVDHKKIAVPKKNKHLGKIKILLIEDDKICQLSQQLLLANMGYQVDVAGDGEEALKKIQEQYYDLIISDLGLPDISGMELAEKIRHGETENKSIPIIALTAHVSSENTHLLLECGINEVVNKPMNQEELHQIITKLLTYA